LSTLGGLDDGTFGLKMSSQPLRYAAVATLDGPFCGAVGAKLSLTSQILGFSARSEGNDLAADRTPLLEGPQLTELQALLARTKDVDTTAVCGGWPKQDDIWPRRGLWLRRLKRMGAGRDGLGAVY
jgi:hypothetical protein